MYSRIESEVERIKYKVESRAESRVRQSRLGCSIGMSNIGFFADIRYAILSNSKFSIPISADTDVDIWVIFPQT